MSILIKGVEMPEGCGECPFEMYYINCGETRCRATNKILAENYHVTSFESRDADCPLIPVPPHGRLIDADVLFGFVESAYKTAQGDARRAYRDILDTIVAAGDVIPAEEGES